jgi:hypothetical protein
MIMSKIKTSDLRLTQPLHGGWHLTSVNNIATRPDHRHQLPNVPLIMSTYTAQSKILHIAGVLAQEEVTAADFILTLLERASLQDNPCTTSLLDNATPIIDAFSKNATSSASTFAWARKSIQKKTSESIKLLTQNDDWHFGNIHASAADLEDFKIEEMAKVMKARAPDLWNLLYILLSGETDADGDHIMEDVTLDGESDAEFDDRGEFAKSMPDIGQKEKRREIIRTIVSHESHCPEM